MKIRLSTVASIPFFNEGDLALRDGKWSEFDTTSLTPEQLDLIEAHTGKIIQFSPDDGVLEAFASEQGLRVEDGRFLYAGTAEENKGKPALGRRHQVEAAAKSAPGRTKSTAGSAEENKDKPAVPPAQPTAKSAKADAKASNPQPVTPVPTNVVDPAATTKKDER